VVSADQIGSFPDRNAAETTQRIPGVSITKDQGEGRYVNVRGTEPRLNSMMIDGQRIPSPDPFIRIFHVYKREGEPGRPHDHSKTLVSFKGGADGTDGLDVTAAPPRSRFSRRDVPRDEQLEPQFPDAPLARYRGRRDSDAEGRGRLDGSLSHC